MNDAAHVTPRWVKVSVIVAVVCVAVFAAVHLAGGGFRHHGSAHEAHDGGAP